MTPRTESSPAAIGGAPVDIRAASGATAGFTVLPAKRATSPNVGPRFSMRAKAVARPANCPATGAAPVWSPPPTRWPRLPPVPMNPPDSPATQFLPRFPPAPVKPPWPSDAHFWPRFAPMPVRPPLPSASHPVPIDGRDASAKGVADIGGIPVAGDIAWPMVGPRSPNIRSIEAARPWNRGVSPTGVGASPIRLRDASRP